MACYNSLFCRFLIKEGLTKEGNFTTRRSKIHFKKLCFPHLNSFPHLLVTFHHSFPSFLFPFHIIFPIFPILPIVETPFSNKYFPYFSLLKYHFSANISPIFPLLKHHFLATFSLFFHCWNTTFSSMSFIFPLLKHHLFLQKHDYATLSVLHFHFSYFLCPFIAYFLWSRRL